ncbi:hypothetical protein [Chitinasiproducens palmae]|uniref:Uncharacterized protein n=1 Tax=Chitinasiproducens palmae TaxID=1770053 RepID=A0A1H2PQK2_9BURK|nr:hypothetical protein [Chitinasiproducens palmae]SDV49066.1 hypothetical protein SAMN05216551_10736 [Chitinasiproducens palmae]
MASQTRDFHAYHPPRPGRLAARHTLLAEIYMGWQMIALGYSGQVGGSDGSGVLHQVLEHLGIDDIWGYSFLLVGVFMLQCAAVEFVWGRKWDDQAIRIASGFRKASSAAALVLWGIALYYLLTTSLAAFKSMTMLVPLHLGMAVYFLWENSRVYFYTGKWNALSASRLP